MGLDHVDEEGRKIYREIKNDYYKKELAETVEQNSPDSILVPGVRKFLATIKKILPQSSMVVASNSVNAEHALNLAQLGPYFNKLEQPQTLIDGKDKGKLFISSKPMPDIFLSAANLHNYDPSECVVFEDSLDGVQAAINGKMRFVTIGELQLPKNESLLGSFKDFNKINALELIKRINKTARV